MIPLLLALGVFAPAAPVVDAGPPTRWAVVVGVGDYRDFGSEVGGDLPGAVNDALGMRDVLLARWGFTDERVKLLVDAEAGRDAIRAAITGWLATRAGPDDVVLFYFAGHGSQAWDADGDEQDGLDETIAPWDALREGPENDILDDELASWLGALPTRNVVVILDNCHAGTGTRAVTPFSLPRTLARHVARTPRPPAATRSAEAPVAEETGVLEIAAAQAEEIAVDAAWPAAGGAQRWGGAFTTLLVRELWRAPPDATYREIFAHSAAELRQHGFAQEPRLSPGPHGADLPLFSTRVRSTASNPPPTLPVVATTDAGVEVAGGSAAGVTVGSLLETPEGILRVTRSDERSARAEVVRGNVPEVGAAARLAAYTFADPRLRVSVADLSAASRDGIAAELSSEDRITLQQGRQTYADLLVRPAENGWVVLGADGATRHRVSGDPRSAGSRVAALLRQELAARKLAALENPARTEALQLSLAGAGSSVQVGDEIAFRARTSDAGFLTLVDLGTDGAVTVLFPNEWHPENRVAAGSEMVVPTAEMRDAGVVFEAQEPVGSGIVRAFLTERPLRLPTDPSGGDVERALRAAAGPALIAGSDAIPLDSWATDAVVYRIDP